MKTRPEWHPDKNLQNAALAVLVFLAAHGFWKGTEAAASGRSCFQNTVFARLRVKFLCTEFALKGALERELQQKLSFINPDAPLLPSEGCQGEGYW